MQDSFSIACGLERSVSTRLTVSLLKNTFSKRNLASLHVPLTIFMSMSSSIAGAGSRKLDGQWLAGIGIYAPPDPLTSPRLGIDPAVRRTNRWHDLPVGLRRLLLLSAQCNGHSNSRST